MAILTSRVGVARLMPIVLTLAAFLAFGLANATPEAAPVKASQVTVSLAMPTWTMVNSADPNRSYWTSYRDYIRVGKSPEDASVRRAFLQADTSSLQGRAILAVQLRIRLAHSASCAPTPVQLWSVRNTLNPNYSVTWTNTANYWDSPLSTVSARADASGRCGMPGDYTVVFSGAALTFDLGTSLGSGKTTFTVGLRAQDETTWSQWKKFRPTSAQLVVTYSD